MTKKRPNKWWVHKFHRDTIRVQLSTRSKPFLALFCSKKVIQPRKESFIKALSWKQRKRRTLGMDQWSLVLRLSKRMACPVLEGCKARRISSYSRGIRAKKALCMRRSIHLWLMRRISTTLRIQESRTQIRSLVAWLGRKSELKLTYKVIARRYAAVGRISWEVEEITARTI